MEVTDLTSGVTVRFPCWRWFARGRGDGVLERDLYPEGSPQALGQPMTQYKVQLKHRSKTLGQSPQMQLKVQQSLLRGALVYILSLSSPAAAALQGRLKIWHLCWPV